MKFLLKRGPLKKNYINGDRDIENTIYQSELRTDISLEYHRGRLV